MFCNRDSAMSRACASGYRAHIYRSETPAREEYDWVRVPGARMRLPYGTVIGQWAERLGCPHDPAIYEQRVWQRDDLRRWVNGDGGQQACVDAAGDTQWHRVCRDADETTRKALLEAEHEIWLRGPTVWQQWLEARATWASKPEVWLKRYPAAVANGKETHTETIIPPSDLSHLADRVRALLTQNDPDAVRTGLREIADALDRLVGRENG